jgi:hypothetical protein
MSGWFTQQSRRRDVADLAPALTSAAGAWLGLATSLLLDLVAAHRRWLLDVVSLIAIGVLVLYLARSRPGAARGGRRDGR